MSYKDPIIDKLIKTFEPVGPSELVGKYFNGDVLLSPKSDMPLAYFAKDSTGITSADNMEDAHLMPMVLTVIYDWTRDLDESYEIVAGASSLYEIMEGRNADYSLKKTAMAYIARANQQIDDKLWISPTQPVTINYGIGIERRGKGIFSVEAVMRFTMELHTAKPLL